MNDDTINGIEQVGVVAGKVWHALAGVDSISMAALTRAVSAPRDTVMQAVGWLAHEGKIEINEASRGRTICLTGAEKQIASDLQINQPFSDAA